MDIFDAAGIKKPEISLPVRGSTLRDVKKMKNKNLGLELVEKILNDEINIRLKFNTPRARVSLEMLETDHQEVPE